MKYFGIILWAVGAALVAFAYQRHGWMGIAVVTGGIVMWMLLHFTRMMTVLKRANNRPMGHVASAVMMNAKLKKGANLLHVLALTRSLGLLQSEKEVEPEIYLWKDAGGSQVTCHFVNGKLQEWQLFRPAPEAALQEGAASA